MGAHAIENTRPSALFGGLPEETMDPIQVMNETIAPNAQSCVRALGLRSLQNAMRELADHISRCGQNIILRCRRCPVDFSLVWKCRAFSLISLPFLPFAIHDIIHSVGKSCQNASLIAQIKKLADLVLNVEFVVTCVATCASVSRLARYINTNAIKWIPSLKSLGCVADWLAVAVTVTEMWSDWASDQIVSETAFEWARASGTQGTQAGAQTQDLEVLVSALERLRQVDLGIFGEQIEARLSELKGVGENKEGAILRARTLLRNISSRAGRVLPFKAFELSTRIMCAVASSVFPGVQKFSHLSVRCALQFSSAIAAVVSSGLGIIAVDMARDEE